MWMLMVCATLVGSPKPQPCVPDANYAYETEQVCKVALPAALVELRRKHSGKRVKARCLPFE